MHTPMRIAQRPQTVAPARPAETSGSWQVRPRLNAVAVPAAALIAALLLTTAPASAQVYKVTDEKNGVTFTDRPQDTDGGTVEKIEIREPNTTSLPTPAATTRTDRDRDPTQSQEEEAPAPQVSITSPGDESTIAMGPGNFTVSARVEPPLRRGEMLVLMVDGQAYGAEQSGTSWFIEGAMRGPHDLVVRRISAAGDTLATSEPVRVYVLRPSIIGR
jgi:hypothetical protein